MPEIEAVAAALERVGRHGNATSFNLLMAYTETLLYSNGRAYLYYICLQLNLTIFLSQEQSMYRQHIPTPFYYKPKV